MSEGIEPLEIVELGHPVLREVAHPVKDALNNDIQLLIDRMLVTLKGAKGVGLAAPQVGVSLRLYIVSPHPNQRYPNCTLDETLVVINPSIKPLKKKREMDFEGCLSIPGIRGLVSRYEEIHVKYTNRLGEKCELVTDDFTARIFQHEHDHIDGVVFLDRMKSMRDLYTDKEYIRLMDAMNEEMEPT